VLREFQHGPLAKENKGILYDDVINLFDDNLVYVLLHVIASSCNTMGEKGFLSLIQLVSFSLVQEIQGRQASSSTSRQV
jgi:Mg-chelatase subunit ChlI